MHQIFIPIRSTRQRSKYLNLTRLSGEPASIACSAPSSVPPHDTRVRLTWPHCPFCPQPCKLARYPVTLVRSQKGGNVMTPLPLPRHMMLHDEQCSCGEFLCGAGTSSECVRFCVPQITVSLQLGGWDGVGHRWGKKVQEDGKGKREGGHKLTIISPAPPHSVGGCSTAITSATFARPPTWHLCPDGTVMRATILPPGNEHAIGGESFLAHGVVF